MKDDLSRIFAAILVSFSVFLASPASAQVVGDPPGPTPTPTPDPSDNSREKGGGEGQSTRENILRVLNTENPALRLRGQITPLLGEEEQIDLYYDILKIIIEDARTLDLSDGIVQQMVNNRRAATFPGLESFSGSIEPLEIAKIIVEGRLLRETVTRTDAETGGISDAIGQLFRNALLQAESSEVAIDTDRTIKDLETQGILFGNTQIIQGLVIALERRIKVEALRKSRQQVDLVKATIYQGERLKSLKLLEEDLVRQLSRAKSAGQREYYQQQISINQRTQSQISSSIKSLKARLTPAALELANSALD